MQLHLNHIEIEQVKETELLGITLDHKLSWSKQIDNVVCKMGRGVLLVKRIVKYLPMDVSRQVLDALVLSQLDYCLVIWSSAAEKYFKIRQHDVHCSAPTEPESLKCWRH